MLSTNLHEQLVLFAVRCLARAAQKVAAGVLRHHRYGIGCTRSSTPPSASCSSRHWGAAAQSTYLHLDLSLLLENSIHMQQVTTCITTGSALYLRQLTDGP
jgi:hypothetical protein